MKKNIIIWIAIFVSLSFLSVLLDSGRTVGAKKMSFSNFISEVEKSNVTTVSIKGKDLNGILKNGEKFYTFLPDYPDLIENLHKSNVEIVVSPLVSKSERIVGMFLGWLPFILMIGLWIFFMKGASGGGKALGFGKSKAKLLQENKIKVLFKDVAGVDEAKEELSEIVDFLRNSSKYKEVGARIPKGCLLIGSPGTGKTLLARAIAGEASVPFFSISGSDFVEMFVGVGASRVRDMFEQGKKSAPCIIFIDEIDAVGRHRGSGVGGGNDEREQTLNQLLVEMDGFTGNEGIIIIAATNRADVLDRALLRPGRFDRQITVPSPDLLGREQILNVHLKKVSVGPDIDAKIIARGTPGFSGADLSNLVNESAIIAAKLGHKVVTMSNLEEAKDKMLMGSERKSMIMGKEEKELTAYHEAGHAIVAINCPNSDPIHKATIIPRGRALGLVMRLPEKDRFSMTRAQLKDDLSVAMGGRVAEELMFGYEKVTTGASSDIEQATQIARNMVIRWGLSNKIGPIFYGKNQNSNYQFKSEDDVSPAMSEDIDKEIKDIVEQSMKRAKEILTDKKNDLIKLAESLIEFETLTGSEIKDLLSGKKISKSIKFLSGAKSFVPDIEE